MVKKTFLLALVSGLALLADQVTLKNGDRLTGTVVKMDGSKLTFKTEMAGDVSIDWKNVTELTSKSKVYVGLKKGQVVEGSVTISDTGVQVESAEAGNVQAR